MSTKNLVVDPSIFRGARYGFSYQIEDFGFILSGLPDVDNIDPIFGDPDPPPISIIGVNLDNTTYQFAEKEKSPIYKKCKALLLTMSFLKINRRTVYQVIRNCEYKCHHEFYVEKFFVTTVKDEYSEIPQQRFKASQFNSWISNYNLKNIMDYWWPNPPFKRIHSQSLANYYPDTPRKRAELESMLNYISSDCTYDRYFKVVFGILSTGWDDAEEIAKKWCMKTPTRFNLSNFNTVIRSYQAHHSNPITIGSIKHWAREGGWR